MNFRALSLALSTITLAALTACGGGGGDSTAPAAGGGTSGGSTGSGSTGGSSGSATAIVDANGSLQTSSSTSSYASGSMGQEVYDALNAARLASGAGALNQSSALDVATATQGAYLTSVFNNSTLTTAQSAEFAATPLNHQLADLVSANLFYAALPMDRAVKSGAITTTGFANETIAGGSKIANGVVVVDGATCVSSLLGTVYHADVALGPFTGIAVSQFTDGLGTPGCVVDYIRSTTYGQVRPAGAVVANPVPNSTVSGTFAINTEAPRPAATLIPGAVAGTPILVSVYNADYINANGAAAPTVTKFEVRDAGGNLVDSVILASSDLSGTGLNVDALLSTGTAVLVPKAPLTAGVYSVSFAGTIKGAAVTKAWSFTAN